jgi:histidinol-phosphatase
MWVIDPIDGTNSFKNRIPLYGTMICLCFQGNPVAGAIDIPEINRRYYGALGMGTRLNGKKILLKDVDPGTSLETQILAVGERIQFINAGKVRFFDHLMESHPHVRTYCDCFGHTLAISGYVGAMADFNLRLWDFLATKILIEEAGGKFTFLNISKPLLMDQKYDILFGKPTIVDWIIQTCVNPSTKRPSKTKNTP